MPALRFTAEPLRVPKNKQPSSESAGAPARGRIFRFTHVATAILKKQFDLSTKCFMSVRSPVENENADSVMPAWIAGIQPRKDAFS
jgi:hypothetical protein